jgi:hypothetical protein
MDSDDLASLNKLEVQVRALQQSAADIAFAPWIKCRLQDSHAHPETHILQQRGLPRAMARALVSRWTVVLQAGLFRKGLLSAVGGFDTSYDVAEDQLLFLKCLLAGARIVHTPECLVVYRTDSSNKLTETAVTSETRFVSWARFLFEARQLCEEAGVHVSGSLPFRLRLWCAWKDLSRCSSSGARELAALLASGLGLPWVGPFYALAQKGAHWQGGLRQRIFGDRSPLALRAGPPRQDQLSLISELGYALQA